MIEFAAWASADEEDTRALAARLGAELQAGDVLALTGELGSGKTRFVQGLARGLKVPPEVPITSPSFTLLAIHDQGRLPLYHFDLFRLQSSEDLRRIGAEEYLWGKGISAVEWAERAREEMPNDALWVFFDFDGEGRRLSFRSDALRWRRIVERLGGGR